MEGIIFTLLLVFAGAVVWRPALGGLIIIVALPSYLLRLDIAGIPTTLLELAIYVWLLVTVVRLVRQKSLQKSLKKLQERLRPILLPLILFYIAATVSVFVADDMRLAAGAWKAWMIDPLLFLLLFVHHYGKQDFKKISLAASLGVLLVSVWGLIEYIGGFGMQIPGFVNAMYQSANMVALLLGPLWLLVLGYVVYAYQQQVFPERFRFSGRVEGSDNNPSTKSAPNSRLPRSEGIADGGNKKRLPHSLTMVCSFAMTELIPILALVLGALTMYLTRSYGGMLGVFVGMVVLVSLLPKKLLQLKKWGVTLILLGVVVGSVGIAMQGKLQSFFQQDQYNSFDTRQQIWTVAKELITEYPVQGIGFNSFEQAHYTRAFELYSPPLEWEVPKAHNLYLNTWLEMGLLGLVSLIWLFIIVCKNAWREIRQNQSVIALATLAAMTAVVVHGLLDTPYFKNDLSIIFWLIIGIFLLHSRHGAKNA